jgi:dephospho-CoA kinase
MARNGLSEKEAQMRIRAQMPLSEKKALADAVIDNNGSPEETKQQLEKIVSDWQLVP